MNTPTRKLRRRPRGQAMIEYSSINVFMIMALCFAVTSNVFPGRHNLLELFLMAYQTYYDSYYFVLNLPFP